MILLGHIEHAEPVIDLRWIDQQLSHTSFTVAQKITTSQRVLFSVGISLGWFGAMPTRERQRASLKDVTLTLLA